MKESIEVTRLSSGLTILTEKMPDVRSATLGFFYRVGARHEPAHLSGICHFIEHCVFKGTTTRSTLDIAVEIDRFGGHFDAFTSHEETAFTIKVVDSQVVKAFELIGDMLTNPVFEDEDLRREQSVIIEEMKMVEDSPEDFLNELFNARAFPDHPIGLSIAGKPETVRSFDHEVTSNFFRSHFTPANLVISAAGNVDHEHICDLAGKFFLNTGVADTNEPVSVKPSYKPTVMLTKKRDLEQTHLLIATPFVDAKSPRRYAANLLANVLGGGTSSRLWQNIREEHGFAYSVGASSVSYQDFGLFHIFAATSPENFSGTLRLCLKEITKIKEELVPDHELQLAKDQICASILLGLEDSGVRAGNLSSCEITHGRQIPVEETIASVRNVESKDLQDLAREYFSQEFVSIVGLGNFKTEKIAMGKI